MNLETVDKLFLELSQVTTATTAKELELGRRIGNLTAEIAEWRAAYLRVQAEHSATEQKRRELAACLKIALGHWIAHSGNRVWGADEREERDRCTETLGDAR
jgi:hypothetical protein